MPGFLRQSTASQSRALGPFISSSDFISPQTGLTIANTDIKLVINGAASANKNSGGGTHRVNGVYGVTFDATDTATVGEMEVSVAVATALVVFDKFTVVEEAVYDAQYAASAPGYVVDQPVNTTKFGGTTVTARDIGASVLLSSGTGTGQLDFTSGVTKANVTQWLGTTVSTPTVAGVPNVNAKTWNDLATVALPLVPTTAGRTLDVSTTGEAGLDWANIGSPTTTVNLSGTTIKAVTDAVTIGAAAVWDYLTSAITTAGSIGKLIKDNLDAAISSRMATYTQPTGFLAATFPTTVASTTNITAGTITTVTNLTNAATAGDLTATMKASVTTAATAATPALSAAGNNAVADAYLDRSNAVETGLTPRQAMRLGASADAGKLSGAATTTVVIRNAVADSKDRITATVDANGNRTAITTDVT